MRERLMDLVVLDRLPRVQKTLRRLIEFILRHRWSLPLSIGSSASLVELASEMREGELQGFDATVFDVVTSWRGSLDGVMLALTMLGDWTSMGLITLLTVVALLGVKRRRGAWLMLVAAGGTLLWSTVLKLIFQRARPENLGYLIDPPASFSFPSGHAMGSMGVLASCLVVLHVLRPSRAVRLVAIVVTLPIIIGVALSRVYFGVHYPSDVIGGQLAAAAWVSAVTGWFYPRLLPGEESLEPAPHV